MKEYMMELLIQALALVLGFVATGIVGYLAKHHVNIKVAGQDVDVTAAIMSVIDKTTVWGVPAADTHKDWSGEQKKQYVTNLAIQALKSLPVPVKDAEKYTPQIEAAIEAALAGNKLEQDMETTPYKADTPVPIPANDVKPAEDVDNKAGE